MRTFCCGCSLKTGCLIVGYFYAIAGAASFAYCVLGGIVLANEENESSAGFSRILFVVGFLLLKFICINILLLVGVYKGKAAYILPWLVWYCVYVVIQGASTATVSLIHGAHISLAAWFGAALVMLGYFALQIYIILVVSTFYHKLKRKPNLLDEEHVPM